jgi:hypothetical protein
MVPLWPFKKKPSKSRLSRQKFVTNVVEYERETDKEAKGKIEEEGHLKDSKFLNAMKLLSKKD